MKIGYHVNRKGTLSEDVAHHIHRIRSIIPDAHPVLQIFVMGPKSTKMVNISDEEAEKVANILEKEDASIVIHGSYLTLPFAGDLRLIKKELAVSRKLGAIGVIVHTSKVSRANGDDFLPRYTILETDATRDVPTVSSIVDTIEASSAQFIIDTAHIYASGVNIHDPSVMEELLKSIPKDKVIGFHLNDTPSALGSAIDRHATLCEGNIFSGHAGKKSLGILLRWATKMGWFMILETPRGDDDDVSHLSELRLLGGDWWWQ